MSSPAVESDAADYWTRRVPSGRGGGHPQAASFIWHAILVDGHGRMDGEARPR